MNYCKQTQFTEIRTYQMDIHNYQRNGPTTESQVKISTRLRLQVADERRIGVDERQPVAQLL